MKAFDVKFHSNNTHFVSVIVHRTRRSMRGHLAKLGHKSNHTNAACWQPKRAQKDHCVAEIHFCRDHLTLATIAHECSHAAHHRAFLNLGVPTDHVDFQEWLATDTGVLMDAVVAWLDKNRIAVTYECVPKRRIV